MPRPEVHIFPGPLSHASASLEAFRGWNSYQNEQAWQIRLHGLFELWRFSPSSRLMFTAHQELCASPYSQINFNPRTARWEEQLLYQTNAGDVGYTLGLFHRCKHDIDNNEPPDDDTSNTRYQPIKRTAILSGATARIAFHTAVTPTLSVSSELGAEYYLVAEDYRSPFGNDKGSWKGLSGAVFAQVVGILPLTESIRIRTLEWISVPWFSNRFGMNSSALPFDARAELAVAFEGAFRCELIGAVDYQFDELVYLQPHETTVFQFGIRLGGF